MMENKNEILGELRCFTCPGVMYVLQSKRKNRWLYARCPVCGMFQPTGKKAQEHFETFCPIGSLEHELKPVEAKKQREVMREVMRDISESEADASEIREMIERAEYANEARLEPELSEIEAIVDLDIGKKKSKLWARFGVVGGVFLGVVLILAGAKNAK